MASEVRSELHRLLYGGIAMKQWQEMSGQELAEHGEEPPGLWYIISLNPQIPQKVRFRS